MADRADDEVVDPEEHTYGPLVLQVQGGLSDEAWAPLDRWITEQYGDDVVVVGTRQWRKVFLAAQ